MQECWSVGILRSRCICIWQRFCFVHQSNRFPLRSICKPHKASPFPSRLQLEKFSAQMHLSHRRSHLCPKRLIALDANCSFGQRRLGSGKTSQSSPVLTIMPGRFLLMCVFDICLTSQQIGTLAELSNRQMFSSQSDKTALLLAR